MTTIVDNMRWDNVKEGKGGVLVDKGYLSTIRYRRLLFLTVNMEKKFLGRKWQEEKGIDQTSGDEPKKNKGSS